MNRRLLFGTVAVVLVVSLAGCATIFGGISDEDLDRETDYDDLKSSDADVAIDIETSGILRGGEFRAVYDLNGTDELSLYRTQFYRDQALDIHSVRYWYPNGTELNGSELDVDQGRSSTEIAVPDGNGTLAISGSAGRSTFTLPAFIEGSYEVTLPDGRSTSTFLFGSVSPGGYDRETVDDREQLRWDENDSTIALRYYQTWMIPIFVGFVAVVLVLGGAAVGLTYRQMKRLQRRREELGLDIDDEDGGRRPPGFG